MLRPAPAGCGVRICKKTESRTAGSALFCADPIQGPAVQNRRPLRKPDFTVPAGDNSGGYGARRCAKYHYTIGRMT